MDYHQQSCNYNLLALRKKCLYLEIFGYVYSRVGTEYGVSLRILSECRKIRTRKTPNTNNFYSVLYK